MIAVKLVPREKIARRLVESLGFNPFVQLRRSCLFCLFLMSNVVCYVLLFRCCCLCRRLCCF